MNLGNIVGVGSNCQGVRFCMCVDVCFFLCVLILFVCVVMIYNKNVICFVISLFLFDLLRSVAPPGKADATLMRSWPYRGLESARTSP